MGMHMDKKYAWRRLR